MEQVNAKRVAIFVVSACLIGMVVGSAVTLAVLNVQRAIPSSGIIAFATLIPLNYLSSRT